MPTAVKEATPSVPQTCSKPSLGLVPVCAAKITQSHQIGFPRAADKHPESRPPNMILSTRPLQKRGENCEEIISAHRLDLWGISPC